MRGLLASAIVLLVCGCFGGRADGPISVPVLTWTGAEQLALEADGARRAAFADLQPVRLATIFRGPALQALGKQVLRMGQRGIRLEERDPVRSLLFWDSRAHEAVLEIVAQDRLVSADQPDPIWAATTRQWWTHLDFQGGGWWVVDQQDLTPDRWR